MERCVYLVNKEVIEVVLLLYNVVSESRTCSHTGDDPNDDIDDYSGDFGLILNQHLNICTSPQSQLDQYLESYH